MTSGAALLIVLLAQAPSAPVPAHDVRPLTSDEDAALPHGDGRDAVAAMCVPCHGILPAIALRKTAVGWGATVDDMRTNKGAQGTDDQADAAKAYLAKFFLAVDVNKAAAKDIAAVTGLTPDEAAAIVAYRDAGNTFKSFADVKRVPGLDPKRLADAKSRIVYAPK
jgi:competence ComEA-like helix-hairpin-helix protein